jgi:mRNA-degrading endonuclease RelE of RelBE toxin-antitoxin system
MKQQDWKLKILDELEQEVQRLSARIVEARKDVMYARSRNWAAVKRATLDVNAVGARLRKGQYR